MITIGILKESALEETRISFTPESVKKILQKKAVEVLVEKGLTSHYTDADYEEAGAKLTSRNEVLKSSKIILKVHKLPLEELRQMKEGGYHISFMDPFNDQEFIKVCQERKISTISMEMIPRTTIAQKMDAISSQANIGGYAAVILSSARSKKILPLMMTPAGTLPAVKVFVIGVGVAGLQAIATAKRLGARVEAFDTRPAVEEQVKSLGAKFIKIDLGETGETQQGYATELSEEQRSLQQKLMEKHCLTADIIITTAKLFGKKSPLLITEKTIVKMKAGTIVVDLAVGSGGNVAGAKLDKEVEREGVTIIGIDQPARNFPLSASQVYSNNLSSLLEHFWNEDKKDFFSKEADDLLKAILITREGKLVHPLIKNLK